MTTPLDPTDARENGSAEGHLPPVRGPTAAFTNLTG